MDENCLRNGCGVFSMLRLSREQNRHHQAHLSKGGSLGTVPYRGNSPVEAWEYWFDVPPSEAAHSHLQRLGKNHPAETTIEAIEITGQKLNITEESAGLQYVQGILTQGISRGGS